MLQLLPGHGWLDLVGIILTIGFSVSGFFTFLAVLISHVDRNADGIPEHWPGPH